MLIPLEEEEQELIHAEEIGMNLVKSTQIISAEQIGVEEQLNEIRSALQKVSSVSEKYNSLLTLPFQLNE